MKKLIILFVSGYILLSMISCSKETMAAESFQASEDYYYNTEIPTFQSITNIPCSASINTDGSVESSDYVSGCNGYEYDNVAVSEFLNYRDQLNDIGAQEIDFESSSTAILIYYEFQDTTFGIYATIADNDNFEQVIVVFA